ncbi:MAG: hypothetical protein KI792_00970 [Alphaproteobacteria bacterium]|nr:hypothetical protein [Alphaproteobacteria bacterium SS10]
MRNQALEDLRQHAERLYELVNQPGIPYANNGSYCHDRAYAMATLAERAGLDFEMAYFLPASDEGMQVDGQVPWTAHVVIATPEVMIDGSPRRFFIDPSLFEGGPIGLQQMQDRLKSPLETEYFKFGTFKPKDRPPHQRDDWYPFEYFGEGNRGRQMQRKVQENLRQAQRELAGKAPMPGDPLPAEPAKPSDGSVLVQTPAPKTEAPATRHGLIGRLRDMAGHVGLAPRPLPSP